jgi:hypothetical protein
MTNPWYAIFFGPVLVPWLRRRANALSIGYAAGTVTG